MRFYQQQHQYYCGVDLHARSMYLHILDADKRTLLDENLPAEPAAFLEAVAPYRQGLVVGAECMFAWYWLADLCEDESIPFTLGHALYMKAIHGGKTKTDKIDAGKIAGLLRGGMFPMAYVYPRAMRETRDLLRRRTFFVRQKAQLIAHITNTNSQYNLPPFERKLSRHPDYSDLAGRFKHPSTQLSISADATLIDQYQTTIAELEKHLVKHAKVDDPKTYHLLQSLPGVGKVLGLVMLYEIQDIKRFPEDGNFPHEAARTPSQALTGTMRLFGSCPDRSGSRFPPASPALSRHRKDRSRRFEETAYGTERVGDFWGAA